MNVRRTAYIALTFTEDLQTPHSAQSTDEINLDGSFTEKGLQDYLTRATLDYHKGSRSPPWITRLEVVLLPNVTEAK